MKKVLTFIIVTLITFCSFANSVLAEPDPNGGGNQNGTGGGGGQDACGKNQLCVWYGGGHTVAYRVSFVYVSPAGNYKNLKVTRTSKDGATTKVVDATMDIFLQASFPRQMDYITDTLGSKAEYLNDAATKSFNLIKINNTNYIEGINYLTFADSKLDYIKKYYQNYYGSFDIASCVEHKHNYCYGSKLLELFVGTEKKDEWNQLLETAKMMGLVPSNATLGAIKNMARDSSGNVLKLLVEPIIDVRFSPNKACTGGACSTKAVLTLTELMDVLLANNKSNGWKRVGYQKSNGTYGTNVTVKETLETRYSCYIPTRFYLDHPDEELRIAQYQDIGITSYLNNKGINPCMSKNDFRGLVATYQSSINTLMSQYCKNGKCYYNYNNVNYRVSGSSGNYHVIINPNFIFNNMGELILDLSDIFASCPPVYRTISLTSPFPGHDGTSTRTIGDNWYSIDNTTVKKYILNNRGVKSNNVYTLEPMYKIVLTPELIKAIRQSNKTTANGYNNNSLKNCDANGQNCQSTFIRDKYKSSFTGCMIRGTC